MKKCLLILTTVLCFNSTYSQVLYSENFDNLSIGNLGTDPNGVIPGQGGWLTTTGSNAVPNNNYFTITNEQSKGKVLTLTTLVNSSLVVVNPGIDTFINQRNNGYNVIKFEIDYYTGTEYYMNGSTGSPPYNYIHLRSKAGSLFSYYHMILSQAGYISASYHNGKSETNSGKLSNNPWGDPLPVDSWVTFIVYMDYTNKKIYFETPHFGTVVSGDFLSQSTSVNLIEDFKPTEISLRTNPHTISNVQQVVHKYDNIKITALKSVPPEIINLSANQQLAAKFNIYPNPATNVVNITNAENMQVQQVAIYDIAGKLLSTQSFNNQTEVQLNVENLASGTYLLHLKTEEGTAVKKLVKK